MYADDPALLLRGVQKSFGRIKVLASISLALEGASLVVLLGPNGAGKSTLMQLLTGLFSADEGEIRILGIDLREDAPKALSKLGVVFQQQTLDLELSVVGNLLFHTDLHGLDRKLARARIDAELARFGLTEQAEAPVRTLSGGMRRRVELARALLHQPRILLMDEATVGLDAATRRDLLEHVDRLKREQGLLILWATHLVEEAEGADKVIVLDRGKILFQGNAEEIVANSGAANLRDAFLSMTGKAASASGSEA